MDTARDRMIGNESNACISNVVRSMQYKRCRVLKPTLKAIAHSTHGYVLDVNNIWIGIKKERKEIFLVSIEYLMNIQSQNP
jgi:hypothetical protein